MNENNLPVNIKQEESKKVSNRKNKNGLNYFLTPHNFGLTASAASLYAGMTEPIIHSSPAPFQYTLLGLTAIGLATQMGKNIVGKIGQNIGESIGHGLYKMFHHNKQDVANHEDEALYSRVTGYAVGIPAMVTGIVFGYNVANGQVQDYLRMKIIDEQLNKSNYPEQFITPKTKEKKREIFAENAEQNRADNTIRFHDALTTLTL